MIVGIDEAGRGPLAGVVVGCALYLGKKYPFTIKDSKALSSLQREERFIWLSKNAIFSVALATPQEIDQINILEAAILTFNRAIKKLLDKAPYLKKATYIIDGNVFRTTHDLTYRCIEKADKKIREVSCASIMAKVFRDYLMNAADYLYPDWNFFKHKGYPTKEHFLLLEKYTLTPLHRRSFSPCKEIKKIIDERAY